MQALTGPEIVRERVREQLGRLPGDVMSTADGAFLVRRGEDVTAVQVVGLQPDVTLVVVFGLVAVEVPQLDGACRFLAARELDLRLVHFELIADAHALIAVHGLLGEFLAGPELDAAIDAVADAAGTLGAQVRARFGGTLPDLAAPSLRPAVPQSLLPVPTASGARRSGAPAGVRARAVLLLVLALALVAGAWVGWGALSGLAVALVLGSLLAGFVVARWKP